MNLKHIQGVSKVTNSLGTFWQQGKPDVGFDFDVLDFQEGTYTFNDTVYILEEPSINAISNYINSINTTDQDLLDKVTNDIEALKSLSQTDWLVLRHYRERELGIGTSISEEDFIKLEEHRQKVATSVELVSNFLM